MPRLTIDGLDVEVPEGTKVIEAAERLGIMIPRFCYHEALGSVGACRMCAVKFLQGPFKGVQMSCMIDAQDGMVVSTTDEEAVEFRRYVIEWLMLNHPHDCPVCDEGGQCLLQDETVSSGHAIRRYQGKKRTYPDQYLGVFIKHEMNRCIQCYRCSRFYQEYAGYRDLGALGIASRVYFGRFADGQLESPFSGNLVDVCPTGVYTDLTARYKVRRWDLERSPSVCIHCSLGCNTVANARYRAVIRIEGRLNRDVNGYFICDLGRFGFPFVNHPERPREARVGPGEVSRDEAVRAAAERLNHIAGRAGNDAAALAVLGSSRSSLETQTSLKRFCRAAGWREPAFFPDSATKQKVMKAVSRLDRRLAVSMREIERADFILAVGSDPINEAPMLALAMRQASRRGARIAVIDPRPISLPFPFEHLPVLPGGLEACAGALVKSAVSRGEVESRGEDAVRFLDALPGSEDWSSDARVREGLLALAPVLGASRKPVIVCGTDIVRESTPEHAADLALLLQGTKERSGLFYTLPAANTFGAALLDSPEAGSFLDILDGIEKGTVKALLVVESDPFHGFPDRGRLERALERLELLVVLDCLPSETVRRARIVIPTTTLFETGSILINQEGRAQFAEAVYRGGTPFSVANRSTHPPRVYGMGIPGDAPCPAWEILADMAKVLGIREAGEEPPGDAPWRSISGEIPALAAYGEDRRRIDGTLVIPETSPQAPFSSTLRPASGQQGEESLELLLVARMFGSEEHSAYADSIKPVVEDPVLQVHPEDAARAGVSDGDWVTLGAGDGGEPALRIRITPKMARGALILPRHWHLDLPGLDGFPTMVPIGAIRRV